MSSVMACKRRQSGTYAWAEMRQQQVRGNISNSRAMSVAHK
jgi:hypothetical protein